MNILVTGGAGYIGSATAEALIEAGHQVTVYDSLVTGHRAAIPADAIFIHADLADTHTLEATLADQKFDAIMHFAAFIEAGESMVEPGRFYQNNFTNTLGLMEAAVRAGVGRFVLYAFGGLYDTVKWAQPILNDNHWVGGKWGKAIKFYSGTFPNSAWVGTKQTETIDTHILGKGLYSENSSGGLHSAQDWSYSFWVRRPADKSIYLLSSWLNAFDVQAAKSLTGDEAGVDYWSWTDLRYDHLHTRFSDSGSGSSRYRRRVIFLVMTVFPVWMR